MMYQIRPVVDFGDSWCGRDTEVCEFDGGNLVLGIVGALCCMLGQEVEDLEFRCHVEHA